MRNLKLNYFKWLYSNVDRRSQPEYIKLCEVLYNRPFIWSVPNDDNRCEDGKDLRETFLRERPGAENPDIIDEFLEEDCTVFEVLVAIAKRMDFILYDLNRSEKTPKWFMCLLENLNLDGFTDEMDSGDALRPAIIKEVDHILDVWLNRKYDRYGNGGLFPIKGNCPRDMRRTELWYQMHAWLEENFPDG